MLDRCKLWNSLKINNNRALLEWESGGESSSGRETGIAFGFASGARVPKNSCGSMFWKGDLDQNAVLSSSFAPCSNSGKQAW